MARVSITVNGYSYDIACADGEEQHILDLAQVVDAKVADLVSAIGQAGEARLLAMAGLLMADELTEVKDQLESARAAAEVAPQPAPDAAPAQPSLDEHRLASVLEALAGRIESIAQRVEQA